MSLGRSAMVRATDRRSLWNIPLDDAVREIVEAPVPSVSADGCADVSLYRRFAQSGLAMSSHEVVHSILF